MEGTIQAYDRVDALPDYLPEVRYPRTPGYRPRRAENPLNAWYVKSRGQGRAVRPARRQARRAQGQHLPRRRADDERRVDARRLRTPDVDATVVTRILDAGGTIVGKAHCEYFCLSGGSHTSATGPVHNPCKLGYSAGGSSSGCAALVGAGEVEMAIGGDQGGSIRMPASFCGCYGMKPTHGLVPYTGIMPIEATIDHIGPMTATVADNALLLEVIAGPDGLDPRQYNVARRQVHGGARPRRRRPAHRRAHRRLPVRLVRARRRLQKVRRRRSACASLGAIVEEVSIPMHVDGLADLDADRARRPAPRR